MYDIKSLLRNNKKNSEVYNDDFQLMLRYMHMLWARNDTELQTKLKAEQVGNNFLRVALIYANGGVPSMHEYAAALTEWKKIMKVLKKA